MDDGKKKRLRLVREDPARFGLGATGFGTLGVGMVATFMHEPATADAAMVVSGIGVAALAILLPRVKHFKISPTEVEADLTPQGEEDAQRGHRFPAEQGVEAAAVALGGGGQLSTDVQAVPPGMVIPPNIEMTSEAMGALTRLDTNDLQAIRRELATLNGNDPKAIEGGGRSYFVRFIHNDLRINYRMLDKSSPEEPARWVVIAIKTDRESSPGRPPAASA